MLKKSEVIDFVWLVDVIAAAKDIYDFWKQPSLNFEKLQGYTNRFSLRLTRVYRLEVTIEWENEKKTVGLVGIEEISKHYQ